MSGMNRRQFLHRTVWASAILPLASPRLGTAAEAPRFTFDPAQNLIPAPSDPRDWPRFRELLTAWRMHRRQELNYSDALYRRPEFASWVSRCFSCGFLMVGDETFCDSRQGRFTVERFLEQADREFGGFDAVVLWHAYPRIGADDRNQFDCYRDLPGGLPGLRAVRRRFARHGVRVFLDYNPWDTGTRREPKTDIEALCELVSAIEADGIFLDTMSQGGAEFRAKLDAARPGVVLEGEGALALEHIHDHHLSWAQWFNDSEAPGVLRNKWFERRHLQHQIKRWDRDHTGELHSAWMNGSGMMLWENVFGSWVGWSARDKSILRAMAPIQRRYHALFCGEGWTPLVPTQQTGVYASRWEGAGLRLWTLVNRTHRPVSGPLLRLSLSSSEAAYDLVRGCLATVGPAPAQPRRDPAAHRRNRMLVGWVEVSGDIPARGVAACLVGQEPALGADFPGFLRAQAAIQARAQHDTAFPVRSTMLRVPPRVRSRRRPPEGMVAVPAARVRMESVFRVRECGFYESVHAHFAGGGGPPLHHMATFPRDVTLAAFAIDLTPVTNEQFGRFLRATRYRPKHPENFLRHWQGGMLPVGKGDHPVAYVALEDARAYAAWLGKRLPTEEEWQYAAQGPAGLAYPWGSEFRPNHCNSGATAGTTRVTAFPAGRSPCGAYDLCGNTWEWTESERSDGRTRFCLLKGGSYYRAEGSAWYFDGGPQTNQFAAKFLLTWAGLDRCATIGFRCAIPLA